MNIQDCKIIKEVRGISNISFYFYKDDLCIELIDTIILLFKDKEFTQKNISFNEYIKFNKFKTQKFSNSIYFYYKD